MYKVAKIQLRLGKGTFRMTRGIRLSFTDEKYNSYRKGGKELVRKVFK